MKILSQLLTNLDVSCVWMVPW